MHCRNTYQKYKVQLTTKRKNTIINKIIKVTFQSKYKYQRQNVHYFNIASIITINDVYYNNTTIFIKIVRDNMMIHDNPFKIT